MNERLSIAMTERLTGIRYSASCVRSAKIKYSIHSILDDAEKFIVLLAFFSLAGHVGEMLVCMFAILLTRSFIGGVHMRTWQGCMLMTTAVYVTSIMGGTHIYMDVHIAIGLSAVCMALAVWVAPLPSPQRPCCSAKRRRRMRVSSAVGICVTIALYFMLAESYSNCIAWVWLLQIIEVVCVVIVRHIYPTHSQA